MTKIIFLLIYTMVLFSSCRSNRPVANAEEFKIGGTSVKLTIPDGFTLIKEPEKLKAYPFPEDQKLYCVMVPAKDERSRYVAVGSKPFLDKHNINKKTFDSVKVRMINEINEAGAIASEVERMKPLIDLRRVNRGASGLQSAKVVGTKIGDDYYMMVAVVLNEDGSEFINCTRMQHYKNKIIVMSGSSEYHDNEDISWVTSVAQKLDQIVK